jgi:DNA-binding CsgD family transcriptional regulator
MLKVPANSAFNGTTRSNSERIAPMAATTRHELVEREGPLARVDEQLDAARRGDGGTLVLDGSAGLGKSVLLDVAAERARSAGLLVLRARGDEFGRHVPHGVLQQLMGRPARSVEPIAHASVATSPAAPLLAAIGVAAIDDPITVGGVATGLWWLLDAIIDRDDVPILILVDDAQLADGPSIQALAFLASRIDGMRCAMLVAQRHGEPYVDVDAAARLRSAAATRIESLDVLSAAAAWTLARTLDPSLDDDAVRHVVDATGGNPFLLTELVRHLEHGAAAAVPPRVLDRMRIRLAASSAQVVRVGAATAALGQWATVARVGSVTGIATDESELLLDELVDAGVLVRTRDHCSFRHPLLRDAMLAAAGDDAERRLLARRAADALDADGADATAIASLLLDAPLAGDPRTSGQLVAGARASINAGAPNEALRFLDRAVAEPITDVPARAEAWLLTSRAHDLLHDTRGAIEAMTAALEFTSDPTERSELRVAIANTRIGASDLVGAMREFESAANEIEYLPSAATRVVKLRASSQSFGRFLGQPDDSDDPLADALPTDPADDTHEHRILLANVAMAHVFKNDDAHRIRALARRALAGPTLLHEVGVEAPLLYAATTPLTWTDDFDGVLPVLDAAVAYAREHGSVLGHATAMSARGGTLWRRGELVRAAADLEASIEARHDGWTSYLPFVGYCAARVFLDLGDHDAVHALVDAAIPVAGLAEWGPLEPFAHAAFGVAAMARGEDGAALDSMLAGVDAARRQRSTAVAIADWRIDAVELAARLGRADEVADLARTTLVSARSLGAPRALGLSLRAAAAVAEDVGERQRLLDDAIAVLEAGGIRLELARSLMRRGELARVVGEQDRAHEFLARSLDHASHCGAQAIIRELEQLGVMSPGSRIRDVLTPSERRVAELALSGLTNREIAHSLFVTIKAVEWHLSNTYRKLDIRGRRDLAGALDRYARG